MGLIAVAARGVHTYLRLTNPQIKTQVLGPEHEAQAAVLLAREFCKREPLCRVLGLQEAEILPFFRQLVHFVAKQQLSIVAVDRAGVVRGVVTSEDHANLFKPDEAQDVPDGVRLIGAYLDQTDLPSSLLDNSKHRYYYCGLAAVDSGQKKSQILSMMIIATYYRLIAAGFTHGYAKITNQAIISRMRKLEKFALTKVFSARETGEPALFAYAGRYPFAGYRGKTSLFSWRML